MEVQVLHEELVFSYNQKLSVGVLFEVEVGAEDDPVLEAFIKK